MTENYTPDIRPAAVKRMVANLKTNGYELAARMMEALSEARAAILAAPAAPQSEAKETAGVTLDGCLETLFRLGEYLGVDYAEARKQPGAPSSVYIKAIEDRLLTANRLRRGDMRVIDGETWTCTDPEYDRWVSTGAAPAAGDALDAARYRWLKNQPEVTPENFTTDRRLSIVVEDWSHNLGSTNLMNYWGSASLHGDAADAAIDAAKAAPQGEGEQ